MLRFESGCTSFELVCSLNVVLYQLRVRWPGCGACWLPAAARARDELVGCFSFELFVVGWNNCWFLEGEWLCMRKFRFFEVFGVGMVGGWVA